MRSSACTLASGDSFMLIDKPHRVDTADGQDMFFWPEEPVSCGMSITFGVESVESEEAEPVQQEAADPNRRPPELP